MEHRHKVRLTTSNTFVLEQDEVKRLYTYLSLFEYRHLRTPNYNEQKLMETLRNDFKRYYNEMVEQCKKDPNNHTMHHIKLFFETHYVKIKKVAEEYSREE